MDVEQFIHQTLRKIVSGVEAAQESMKRQRATICPPLRNYSKETSYSALNDQPVQVVEFDIAVTVTEGTNNKTGGALTVAAVVGVGHSRQKEQQNQTVSRVKFSVPVMLPMSEEMPKSKPMTGTAVVMAG